MLTSFNMLLRCRKMETAIVYFKVQFWCSVGGRVLEAEHGPFSAHYRDVLSKLAMA